MKKVLSALFVGVFLLSACVPAKEADALPAPPMRFAMFKEIENIVQARVDSRAALEEASLGMRVYPGGSAQSGDDSRARLDLAPEGTIIRLAPNSTFTVEELGMRNESPFTRIKLIAGELWVILFGGELQTETPYGTATVHGSMMSVRFDPEGEGMVVSCLEGHCTLENDNGSTELEEGEISTISSENEAPAPPLPLEEEETEAWKDASPEAASWLAGTPIAPTPIPLPEEEPASQDNGKESGPLIYHLDNNCPDRTWYWEFKGPVSTSFTLGPGETASGTLPAGDYMVMDILAEIGGSERDQTGPGLVRGGGTISLKSCPDGGK
jgi:hypothetical protein